MSTYVVGRTLSKTLCYIFLITLFIICILPVYILLINATRSTADIFSSYSFVPGTHLMDNYTAVSNVLGDNGLLIGFRNSAIVAFSSTFLTIYFSMLTAYALVVYDIKVKKVFFGFILAMVLVPGQLFLIGYFQYVNWLGLLNTFWPLIIPSIAAPGTVFFMKQYLEGAIVPELIQAARIDGASEFAIFNKIAMPLAAPGAFTFAIFAFVGSWNAFMGPLFLIGGDQAMHTLPILMRRIQAGGYVPDQGAIYFAMAVTLVPIIVIYAMFSRYIITGITLGSIKE